VYVCVYVCSWVVIAADAFVLEWRVHHHASSRSSVRCRVVSDECCRVSVSLHLYSILHWLLTLVLPSHSFHLIHYPFLTGGSLDPFPSHPLSIPNRRLTRPKPAAMAMPSSEPQFLPRMRKVDRLIGWTDSDLSFLLRRCSQIKWSKIYGVATEQGETSLRLCLYISVFRSV